MAAVRPASPPPAAPSPPPESAKRPQSPWPEPAFARAPLVSLSDLEDDDDDVPTAVSTGMASVAPPTVAQRDRAAMLSLDGSTAGQATMLDKEEPLRIGRGRDASLRIDDDGVSRLHAMIEHNGRDWVLSDLGSRNGTVVQGERTIRRVLNDGDLIHFGPRTTFRFALMDEKQEALYRQLFESSVRDPLTGAYNRLHFDDRLQSEVAYAKRHGTNMSLVLFDLDHFKRINDTYGHPAGDAVLKFVAAVVATRLRTEDVFARYGGEEFAVILRGIDLSGSARAAERLRGAIGGGAASIDGKLVPVTISVGCATLGCCETKSGEELVRVADRRLYIAKRFGRNRVVASDTP